MDGPPEAAPPEASPPEDALPKAGFPKADSPKAASPAGTLPGGAPAAAAVPGRAPLAGAPLLVATRFSFLGRSGWKSDASRDAAQLFAPERLALRLALFSQITLPSLAAQTDPGFHHLILTSADLPEPAARALAAACLAAHGDPGRFTILARPVESARKALRRFLGRRYPGRPVAQVVLDDDDGLACDFIALLRAELARLDAERPDPVARLPYFLSFPRGYGLMLRDRGQGAAGLYLHRYPWINLGLTLLDAPEGKNLFGVSHRSAPRRFGGRLLEGPPMFLRAVHAFNDSRVALHGGWDELPDWRSDATVQARFPWLLAPDTLWA